MGYKLVPVFFLIALNACGKEKQGSGHGSTATSEQCGSDARQVVEQLGERMRQVSLLAPDSTLSRSMRDAYVTLVTPELLSTWQKTPASAPGRQVSNPWPIRIEISSIGADSDCRVQGDVVYVTSADTTKAVERRPVSMQVRNDDGWRVSAFRW